MSAARSPIPAEWLPVGVDAASARVVGCDENGYGAIAGPLFTTGVVLPPGIELHPALRDSKRLDPKGRLIRAVADWVCANAEVFIEVTPVDEIDRLNVYQANRAAYARVIARAAADLAIVDGNLRLDTPLPYRSVVKADTRFAAVAAASIVGKVSRDALMRELALDFPGLCFENGGYGKPAIDALIAAGARTPHHRRSFHIAAFDGPRRPRRNPRLEAA